jgi:hypothetical protein
LESWFSTEIQTNPSPAIRSVVLSVYKNLGEFVSWPTEALLLWDGCDRIPEPGKKQKYHRYPEPLKLLRNSHQIPLDARPNGPAIAAFLVAGGIRHARLGSSNAWEIHHLYSGKYPYNDKAKTLHAIKHQRHFTQSAGLVAVHPIANGICDEFPAFVWILRIMAYQRFGYDPDHVFAVNHNEYGFVPPKSCRVIYSYAD